MSSYIGQLKTVTLHFEASLQIGVVEALKNSISCYLHYVTTIKKIEHQIQ